LNNDVDLDGESTVELNGSDTSESGSAAGEIATCFSSSGVREFYIFGLHIERVHAASANYRAASIVSAMQVFTRR